MDTYRNAFREALVARERAIGLWMGLADPTCAEICAGAGFDWLLVDGEHAPNDLRSILAQLRAVAPYDVEAVVRPPVGDAVVLKQYLDLGARSLIVPMVESAGQARALVAATRYPPRGVRGVGSALARASRWNTRPDYLARADSEVCLVVQIESRAGLDALDEIVAVEGVDGVFIGPADLSGSLGHLGNPGHPEVTEAVADAARRVNAAGKAVGILTSDETLARDYLAGGFSFVAVGVDTTLLARATRALAARFREGGGEEAGPERGGVY
ncbi:4-hydroxy-2-oxoheptanedioate aldolase [Deinococcus pimensis]|uniref:4-hydroxy-2-oxoheptanedioate aldolase n=1 Tax=Deinococcus pimensis TaxID=309888 RepID=UPI0004890A72|nr:4-hydroxy-2-oxoheptanedioate aldolase [Deinococcus pimensis]